MATCPRDGAAIDVDYGMATCPVCGVVLFIDMDGEAQLGNDQPPPVPEEEDVDFSEVTQIGQSEITAEDDIQFEEMQMEPFQIEAQPADVEPVMAQPPDVPIEPVPLSMEEYATGGTFAGDPTRPSLQDGSPGDPLGIQEYANSEISRAKDGPLLVRILISGIDTKEIRESLREAITDSRFGWDVDAVMSTIAKGELRVENVSPVKASIAINRIKRLPVRIRWEQYAVTQAEQL